MRIFNLPDSDYLVNPPVVVSTVQAGPVGMVGMSPGDLKRETVPPAGPRGEVLGSNYHLPQVWADYLDSFNPWSWYGHLTFRGYPHPEQAEKTFQLWTHKLNRSLFGPNYWKHKSTKGITWARGTELQGRGAIHYHFIAGRVPDDVRRFDWMDEWYRLGGISRIYPYESGRGAEYYMSKSTYAWKRGEIDLGGPLPQRSLTL